MILALLLAAQPQVVAVLEFRDKVPAEQRIDIAYLSDQVRAAVKEAMPRVKVITRENMLVLLQASGKDLGSCEGECEVDTGRRIGADLVVSGELLRFGTQYKLNMKLHDTRSGELLSGAVASGGTADDLDRNLRPAVDKLVAPLTAEAHQERLSDRREAARRALAREQGAHRYPGVLFSFSATAGYASSSAASGFAYGFGGQFFLHVAGPLFLGVLADLGFLPLAGDRTGAGLLAGGGALLDLDGVRLFGGAGYSEVSNGGGAGYGALAGARYGIFLLQVAWRRGTTDAAAGLLSQTNAIFAAQGGLSITF